MTVRLEPGATIGGDFTVIRPLAEGGFGAVYEVEQGSTGVRRALKVLHPHFVTDPASRVRFVEEAKIGGRIPSEHVVQVLGAGVDAERGIPWLAMELLEGDDLGARIARTGALSPALARAYFSQLDHALGAAHARGIVHRDLKPENIFLARSRRAGGGETVKVLDFGIAKTLQAGRTAATATAAMGSPLFMAPEQASVGAAIRSSTDVWPIGLIAFYALTGAHYWRAAAHPTLNLQAVLAETLVHALEPASTRARELAGCALPNGFDAWFARCVVRDPEARFADASKCLEVLDRVLSGQSVVVGSGRVAEGQTRTELGHVAASAPAPVTARGPARPESSSVGQAASPVADAPPIAAGSPPVTPRRAGLAVPIAAGLGVLLFLVAFGGAAWLATRRGGPSPEAAPAEAAVPPVTPTGAVPAPPAEAPEPTPPPPSQDPEPVSPPPRDVPGEPRPVAEGQGWISVNTIPATEVFVDDQPIGSTPIVRHPLAAGRHRVLLLQGGGGQRETLSVTIRPGQTRRVIRRLGSP